MGVLALETQRRAKLVAGFIAVLLAGCVNTQILKETGSIGPSTGVHLGGPAAEDLHQIDTARQWDEHRDAGEILDNQDGSQAIDVEP
jgi:hypothetical protein